MDMTQALATEVVLHAHAPPLTRRASFLRQRDADFCPSMHTALKTGLRNYQEGTSPLKRWGVLSAPRVI